MLRIGRISRPAKMNEITPPKLMPPVHSTRARGTLPIEHEAEHGDDRADQRTPNRGQQRVPLQEQPLPERVRHPRADRPGDQQARAKVFPDSGPLHHEHVRHRRAPPRTSAGARSCPGSGWTCVRSTPWILPRLFPLGDFLAGNRGSHRLPLDGVRSLNTSGSPGWPTSPLRSTVSPCFHPRNEGVVTVQIAMMGLGRMGANLVRRLVRDGHHCVVYDRDLAAVDQLVTLDGVTGARDLGDLVSRLDAPRAIWVMVPAAVVGAVVDDLSTRLEPGDIVIDGGNSHYRDDIDRADSLAKRGIQFVDVGTSGGVFGLERGFCLMIGGESETVAHLDPIFATLAPGLAAAERSPGRAGEASTAERGYLHCGPSGAGHFVKMVHNGIEYGLMAGYAEGLGILAQAGIGNDGHETDAETTPLRDPRAYQYNLDVPEITELWRRGS